MCKIYTLAIPFPIKNMYYIYIVPRGPAIRIRTAAATSRTVQLLYQLGGYYL